MVDPVNWVELHPTSFYIYLLAPSALYCSSPVRTSFPQLTSLLPSMAEAAPTTTPPVTFTVPEFDPSAPNGGDTLTTNVNTPFTGLEFNYAYIIFCGYIVFLILPGLGLFYAGLSKRKSGLSMLFLSLAVTAVVSFQWIFWGFSLAFSRTATPFIGDLSNFGMKNVSAAPSVGSAYLPDIVFCFYQLMFCACTVMIVIGGAFERGKIVPSLIFGFIWATVVYCPIACWTWNPEGWLYNLPSLDFAGGGPVHQASGWAALAYAFVLGKRRAPGAALKKSKAHNASLVFLSTVLIWYVHPIPHLLTPKLTPQPGQAGSASTAAPPSTPASAPCTPPSTPTSRPPSASSAG